MRVLYVLRYYPTLTETFVYREITALLARGVDVTVLALGTRADGALADELPEVRVIRPPQGAAMARVVPRAVASARALRVRQAIRSLRPHQPLKNVIRALWAAQQAQRLGIQRVHAHFAGEAAEWGLAIARVAGVPFSVTVHATDLFRPRPSLGALLAGADPVITVASYHQRWMDEHYGVRSVVVRCGVPIAEAAPSDPGGEGPLRVIAVGRNVPKKGLDLLVDAVRSIPEVQLNLISDAPRSWQSDRISVSVLPPSRVPDALASAHLFALPCRVAPDGDRDGVPVALIEAMAMGLPVLSTPVSGIPEILDDTVGWMIPADDVAALTAALRAIARDPLGRARRGAAARQRVIADAWTVDRQADDLCALWGAP